MRQTTTGYIACLLLVVAPACEAGSPWGAVQAATQDAGTIPDHDRPNYRWLWHPGPRGAIEDFDAVLRFQVNSISREAEAHAPVRVAADLWRVDLRLYGWKRETWEKFAGRNFYFEEKYRVKIAATKGKKARTVTKTRAARWLPSEHISWLIEQTESEAPIVAAPWFIVQVCRQLTLTNEQLGTGYYDFLGVKNRDDFFALARFKAKDSQDLGLDIREAVSSTVGRVSKQSRQVDREKTLTGSLWFTLDTDNDTGRGNAVKNLRRGDFVHKAEEHYLTLPNCLPAMLLCDNNGNLQASAPDFIGGDTSPLNTSIDIRIHVFVACNRCHLQDVLKPINGWARKNYTIDRLALMVPADFKHLGKDKQFELFKELKRQYLSDMNTKLAEDREAYRRAYVAACGLEPAEIIKRHTKATQEYIDLGVGLEQASRELGYTAAEVRIAFHAYSQRTGTIDPELGALVVVPEDAMPRLHWEERYQEAQRIMSGEIRP